MKEELDKKQKEKEQLLEKAAKGRQILLNSQFTDQASVEKYRNETRQHFEDHASAKAACNKRSRSVGAFLLMFLAMLGIGSSLFFLLAPETGISLLSSLAPRFLQLSPATLQLPALLCGHTVPFAYRSRMKMDRLQAVSLMICIISPWRHIM